MGPLQDDRVSFPVYASQQTAAPVVGEAAAARTRCRTDSSPGALLTSSPLAEDAAGMPTGLARVGASATDAFDMIASGAGKQ
jgi:hypothetical protein